MSIVAKASIIMRLINVRTLEMKPFFNMKRPQLPPYAALSHRWTENEMTYEDYMDPSNRTGTAFDKIRQCCNFIANYRDWRQDLPDEEDAGWHVSKQSVEWVWIDTCCINRKDAGEVSEAINSMAKWYRGCIYCVAYLSDVQTIAGGHDPLMDQIDHSQWFKRALQELLFPDQVVFCNVAWELIGLKLVPGETKMHHEIDDCYPEELAEKKVPEAEFPMQGLVERISKITSIPTSCLRNAREATKQSVARRMSWAAERITTREEDQAYCLMGLFNVSMPLLYGEGKRAFSRLQQEIIKQSDDESIFAWGFLAYNDLSQFTLPSLLAIAPRSFHGCGDIHRVKLIRRQPYRIVNKYLEFESRAIMVTADIRKTLTNQTNARHMGRVDMDKINPEFSSRVYLVELNCVETPGRASLGTQSTGEREISGARTCILGLWELADGTFRRALPKDAWGGGAALLRTIKPQDPMSFTENKLFRIELSTTTAHDSANFLRRHNLPALLRLDNYFLLDAPTPDEEHPEFDTDSSAVGACKAGHKSSSHRDDPHLSASLEPITRERNGSPDAEGCDDYEGPVMKPSRPDELQQ